MAALRAAMQNPGLRRVELAWGASIGAEWAHFVALGVFAYDAGGASAVGIAGLARMLPAAVVAPLATSLGDRFRRERFLLATALVDAAALAASAVAFFTMRNEVLVFALAGVIGVASTVFRPALQAILPSLARTPEELIAANGASSTIESLGTLAGPLLAGLLVAAADPGFVFAAAGGVVFAGALLLAPLRVEGVIQETAARTDTRELLLGGFGAVKSGTPRLVLGLMAAQGFVRGCLNVLIVVVVFRVLDAGDGAVGYLTASLGLGGLLGAFGAMTLQGRRLAATLGAALVFWGLPIALMAPRPYLPAAVFLLAVVGAANSVEDVAGFTLLQRTVPDAVLSRALGLVWGAAMGAVALGSIVAPAVVAAVGPRAAFAAVGAILPVLTLASWHRLRRIDREVVPPVAELAVVSGVPLFAPPVTRGEGAPGPQAHATARRAGRGGGARGRDRRSVLHRPRRRARDHERGPGQRRQRRLLRRDRAAARRSPDGNRPCHLAGRALRARPGRLPRGGHALGGSRCERGGGGRASRGRPRSGSSLTSAA